MSKYDSLVTIIIPTHKRQNYLRRILSFFNTTPYRIIVVDSTDEPYVDDLMDNVSYYHLPDMRFPEKIKYAISECSTPYIQLSADDDYIKLTALEKGIEFLEKNKSFSTYVGEYLGVKVPGNEFVSFNEVSNDLSFKGDTVEKITSFIKGNYQILWSLNRKTVVEKVFNGLSEVVLENDNFIELYFATYIFITGNMHLTKEIWGCRSIEDGSWGRRHDVITSQGYIESADFRDLQNTFEFSQDKDLFLYFVQTYINKHKKSLLKSVKNKASQLFTKMDLVEKRDSEFESLILENLNIEF